LSRESPWGHDSVQDNVVSSREGNHCPTNQAEKDREGFRETAPDLVIQTSQMNVIVLLLRLSAVEVGGEILAFKNIDLVLILSRIPKCPNIVLHLKITL
jgi:hypothetical protein